MINMMDGMAMELIRNIMFSTRRESSKNESGDDNNDDEGGGK